MQEHWALLGWQSSSSKAVHTCVCTGVGGARAISAGEKNLRALQHNFVKAVVLSVSWERAVWSLPPRNEQFQHLDNEKKCFLREKK